MSTAEPQPHSMAAAVLFCRQFAILISAGVSLVRTLLILETEAPPPYANAMRGIRERVQEGQTLTQAIAGLPVLFPPFLATMIRVGEVGGILEITSNHVAELLEEDWTLSRLAGVRPMLMTGRDASGERDQLSPVQRTLQLQLFCRALGAMLASGVPILLAMEVAAGTLHPRQHAEVIAARQVMEDHGTSEEVVAQMTFMPASARMLFILGLQSGELDALLMKGADLYRYQLSYQRQAEQ